jgi:hypothetical protein
VGAWIHGNNGGSIPSFTSTDDDRFGLLLDSGASHWRVGTVNTSNEGTTTHNQAGTGVELWSNNTDNTFDSITSTKNPGYALALNHGASYNTFNSVSADQTGAWDGDPGITFADGANHNRITKASVTGHTVGLRFGENDCSCDRPITDNWVGTFTGSRLAYGAIRFEHGDRNRVDTANLTDIQAVFQPWVQAAIEFSPLPFATNGNSIGNISMFGSTRPPYGIHFGSLAQGNHVDSGSMLYSIAPFLDLNGSNTHP